MMQQEILLTLPLWSIQTLVTSLLYCHSGSAPPIILLESTALSYWSLCLHFPTSVLTTLNFNSGYIRLQDLIPTRGRGSAATNSWITSKVSKEFDSVLMVCTQISQVKGSVYKTAPNPSDASHKFRLLQYFWPTGCKAEVPKTASLGSVNLLEILTGLRETSHLLNYQLL